MNADQRRERSVWPERKNAGECSFRRGTDVQPFCQRAHAKSLKHHLDSSGRIPCSADSADEPHSEQRVPSEIKEIIVDTDGRYLKNFRKQRAQHLLMRGTRGLENLLPTLDGNLDQSGSIDLAVDGKRPGNELCHASRRHILRQPVLQKLLYVPDKVHIFGETERHIGVPVLQGQK
jgi:hypothetical protein